MTTTTTIAGTRTPPARNEILNRIRARAIGIASADAALCVGLVLVFEFAHIRQVWITALGIAGLAVGISAAALRSFGGEPPPGPSKYLNRVRARALWIVAAASLICIGVVGAFQVSNSSTPYGPYSSYSPTELPDVWITAGSIAGLALSIGVFALFPDE